MAARIAAFDVAAGTVSIVGDADSSTADSVTLSMESVHVGGGVYETRLAHDLENIAGTANYADSTDVDPSAGVAHIVIGAGSAPRVTASLGAGADVLTLDASMTPDMPVTFDGGAGANTVQALGAAANTWTITGGRAGTLAGSADVTFSGTDALIGGDDADMVVGRDADSTWTFGDVDPDADGAIVTYDDAATTPIALQGMEVFQAGSGADTFDLIGSGFMMFVDGSIRGGDGADVFNVRGVAMVTGALDGQAGADTLSFASYYIPVTLAVSGAPDADGFAGTELSGLLAGFEGMDSLVAGSDQDYLVGADRPIVWTVDGGVTYTDGASNLAATGFGRYIGGTAQDLFNIEGDTTTGLSGGDGADLFSYADGVTLTGDVDGGSGADTLDFALRAGPMSVVLTASADGLGFSGTDGASSLGFAGVDSITGSAGADSLTGEDLASTWNLDGSPTYADGTAVLPFSGFEVLQGGSAIDTFAISAATGATLRGGAALDAFHMTSNAATILGLDGQADAGTLSYAGATDAIAIVLQGSNASGYAGTATRVGEGNFAGIGAFTGGSGTADSITGVNAASAWAVSGAPTYTDHTGPVATLAAIEDFQGGSKADTFAISAATAINLAGNAGADSFTVADEIVHGGTLAGGADSDTLDLSAQAASSIVALSGSTAANGFAGSATGTSGFGGIDAITASIAGVNSVLTGVNAASTWELDADPRYGDGTALLAMTGFDTYQGNAAADAFTVSVAATANLLGGDGADGFVLSNDLAAVTGTLDGQAGSDTLSYAGQTSGAALVLQAAGADGYSGTATDLSAGFANIDVLTGSGAASDSLRGLDVASAWGLDGSPTYTDDALHVLGFTAIETLTGGESVDTFTVSAATSAALVGGEGNDRFLLTVDGTQLTGSIAGGAGADTLSYAGRTAAVDFALTGAADGWSGTTTGIATGGFSQVETIVGGTDTGDTLTGLDEASTWAIDADPTYTDANSHVLDFDAIETLQGRDAVDTYQVSVDASTLNLLGGAALDVFAFMQNGAAANYVDGEADGGDLTYAGTTDGVQVNLLYSDATGYAGTASNLGSFGGILSVLGGSGRDTMTGEDLANVWTVSSPTTTYSDGGEATDPLPITGFEVFQGGGMVDTFNVVGNVAADLKGGLQEDVFVLATDNVILSGSVDGESGDDTISYAGYNATASALNLATRSATGVTGFASVERLVGGINTTLVASNKNNTWTIKSGEDSSVDTGVLAERFYFQGAKNLTGGTKNDTFKFDSGAGVGGSVNGGAGTDTLDFSGYGVSVTANLSANNGGTIASEGVAFGFVGTENLVGGGAADTFNIGVGKTLSGVIDGMGGSDTLSYAGYTTTVRVSLAAGSALGIMGGVNDAVSRVENVVGGSAADVLIGNSLDNTLQGNGGNDVLTGLDGADNLIGDAGRDILIGGNGVDVLDGGSGEDLLISGYTNYDMNLSAMLSLMAEWGRTDLGYAARISHINGTTTGGRNGAIKLNVSTLHSDGVANTITGGLDDDWFITNAGDTVTDKAASERRDNIS
jgi:acrosin